MAGQNGRLPLSAEGIKRALARSGEPSARRSYIRSLSAEVAKFEERYRIRSEFLQEAVRSGKLTESLDVANWSLAYQALIAAKHGRKARVERPRKLPARSRKSA